MAKMTDWTSRFSSEARDAFVQMKQEIPLICFEMTDTELDFAFKRNRQQAWERQKRVWKMIAGLIFGIDLVIILSFLLINPTYITRSFGLIGGTSVFLVSFFFLLSYWQIRRVENKAEVLVSYSGAFYLGSFYPFRISYTFLSSASYVESGEGDPPLLRLNFTPVGTLKSGTKFDGNLGKSDYLIEIPLRSEHIEKIHEIINTLVPENENGEVIINVESPQSQVLTPLKLIEFIMNDEELTYALSQYRKACMIAFIRTIPEIMIITGGLIWFLISLLNGEEANVYTVIITGTCLLSYFSLAIIKPFQYMLSINKKEDKVIINSDSLSFLSESRYFMKKWSTLKSVTYDPNGHSHFGILTLKFSTLHSWNLHTGSDASRYEIPIRDEFRNQMYSILEVINPKSDPFDSK
jgi:hypothetical protein